MLTDFFKTQVSLAQFIVALKETFVMVGVSFILGMLLGSFIAIILVLTRPQGIKANPTIYRLLNPIINVVRSIPFIILLVAIIPFTRFIVGTSIGTSAAIVPLTLYIAPFISRLVESSLLEVDPGMIEVANSIGASTFETVWYFILPEAKASLILNFTTAIIGLIGATAMAGAVGAGGIGDLALNYGYQRFDGAAMLYTVLILVALVQGIQSLGNYWAHKIRP